ncbi:MAG: AAA family ATPase [bacterium]|nr:AAA family ATPase [bacterium]
MTQPEALTILKTGANIFLTGEPGSGKTHTINEYTEWLRACGIEPSVTAATGIAATHVAGMTLHSWSGIGISEHLSPADIDRIASKEHVARRIQKAKILIIEEVSMLSAATFEMADAICREVRTRDEPFGGLQVVMVGDFFQLPPVAKQGRPVAFAYDSRVWRALNPIVCYLSEQYRQDDTNFLAVLSAIRRNEVEDLHYEQLMARRSEGAPPGGAPKLFSHNADVDRINAEELAKLPGKAKRYLMTSKGRDILIEGLKRGCLSPAVLELKEGASVMFTKNAPEGRFVNGTLGTVTDFDTYGMPVVETRDGETVVAEPMEWRVEEEGKIRASVSQVPLRLAYAMTVHKSQGMSMDAAVIDLSRAFEYGQGYVALSRVRRLAGLHLLGLNARALEVHPEVLEKDREFRAAAAAASLTFADLPLGEIEEMQKKFVKAQGGALPVAGSTKFEARNLKQKGRMSGRLALTLQTVRDAQTLKKASILLGLTQGTVIKHLEELKKLGSLHEEDFEQYLPNEIARRAIQRALTDCGGERLSPVYNRLGGRYSFEEIRLVRLLD